MICIINFLLLEWSSTILLYWYTCHYSYCLYIYILDFIVYIHDFIVYIHDLNIMFSSTLLSAKCISMVSMDNKGTIIIIMLGKMYS